MFSVFRHPLVALVAACAVVLGTASTTKAAWVTIKNETGKTIHIQETTVVNGQERKGKPTKLLPGETIREYLPGATIKKIEILDTQKQSLWSGKLNCRDENQTFSVSAAGDKVKVGQVANPPTRPKK